MKKVLLGGLSMGCGKAHSRFGLASLKRSSLDLTMHLLNSTTLLREIRDTLK